MANDPRPAEPAEPTGPGADVAERLASARLLLLFTPELVPSDREPLDVLAAVLPYADVVQVRAKARGAGPTPAPARATLDWTRRAIAAAAALGADAPLVLVDDRVDVAARLAPACAGVHLGQDDCPPDEARRLLGARACIGLSTHGARQVAFAQALPVDYLGFGPVFATATKGYGRGLGAEAAWIASEASALPVFPIGGVDVTRAAELAPVGRAAVGSAILGAQDPAAAAREIRALLEERS